MRIALCIYIGGVVGIWTTCFYDVLMNRTDTAISCFLWPVGLVAILWDEAKTAWEKRRRWLSTPTEETR